jgi:hypothetical protein
MTTVKSKILAFDIGIKNLAFCLLDRTTSPPLVIAIENCNILEPVEHVPCFMCKVKASYKAGDNFFCKRHIPGTHSILKELDGKKLPQVATLKELVKSHNCEDLGKTKDKLLESLSKKFAMPFTQPKQENASKISLELIHDSLRKFVNEKWHLFSGSTQVLLENQPVLKNPHMKSVQVLLFATLREKFISNGQTPSFHLIHAKKKVEDAPKGDEGYSERKQKSENRLISDFTENKVQPQKIFEEWNKAKKKSDMADAFCMCMDF